MGKRKIKSSLTVKQISLKALLETLFSELLSSFLSPRFPTGPLKRPKQPQQLTCLHALKMSPSNLCSAFWEVPPLGVWSCSSHLLSSGHLLLLLLHKCISQGGCDTSRGHMETGTGWFATPPALSEQLWFDGTVGHGITRGRHAALPGPKENF